MSQPKKICIVTPDIVGPIRNGGIGTACFHLGRFLSTTLGHKVAILFTGPVEVGSAHGWKSEYRKKYEIDLFTMADCGAAPALPCHNGHWFIMRSLRIHDWLMGQQFDQIHFQEWQANGFIPVQAKRSGLAYGDTLLTCTLHSSTEWIAEGAEKFGVDPHADMLLKYCEKYVARHADVTISPSRYMLKWCEAKGWGLQNPEVIPNLFEDPPRSGCETFGAVEELCFFGRLETRKGLEVYLAALNLLLSQTNRPVMPKLTFLGKCGTVSAGPAEAFVKQFGARHGLPTQIIDNLSAGEAIAYLRANSGCVAVLPSLLDNYPYTVLECLQNGIRFIASDVGGIPEMVVGDTHLFSPTPRSLAVKLEEVLKSGLEPATSAYRSEGSREQWKQLASRSGPATESRQVQPSDITVCIAHYNYGRYLPGLLRSLQGQTVKGFSVVAVDDGSTDAESRAAFRELAKQYASNPQWVFLEKANGGIGETRNYAASMAKTEYLVFMDADNEAEPDMIDLMARAMSFNPSDCLTCFMRAFEDGPDDAEKRFVYHYLPSGPCLEAGVFNNCFGDANFIVRASAFWAIGGFGLRRDASFEDWEFLARLALEGFTQDVIPKPLFLYRHTPGGFSRTTSTYLNHMRIIDAYGEKLPEWARKLLADIYVRVCPHLLQSSTSVSSAPNSTHKPGILRGLERAIRNRRKRLMARLRKTGRFQTVSDL